MFRQRKGSLTGTRPRSVVGAFLGSLFTAVFGEQLGRRWSIGIGVVVMMVGAVLQATAYTRAHLMVARIVAGFGLGAVNSTVPVFQAEFAPKATRGLCTSQLFVNKVSAALI